jgi:hypothetical protein
MPLRFRLAFVVLVVAVFFAPSYFQTPICHPALAVQLPPRRIRFGSPADPHADEAGGSGTTTAADPAPPPPADDKGGGADGGA